MNTPATSAAVSSAAATAPSPFHPGEQAVQRRMGVREAIEPWARQVIRAELTDQHREFYAQLPFVVVAARDAQGRPWATMLTGEPGFLRAADPRHLDFCAAPVAADPLADALVAGADVGLLGIELDTRRRNRVNGRLAATAGGLTLEVSQAFGNCPQYINPRTWSRATPGPANNVRRSSALTPSQQQRIRAADTLFIASGHGSAARDGARFGMDASHRGGAPGFVRVVDQATLVIPDYAGNNHFNTVGNLVADPRVGLLFVDFERGGLLHLSGRASIEWNDKQLAQFPGAARLLVISIEAVVDAPSVLPLRWSAPAESQRDLRLVARREESTAITSFEFAARDGGALPAFNAGQYLPVEVRDPATGERLRRTYSLSHARRNGLYRISVKREPQGRVSALLHDELQVGAIINSFAPAGEFVLKPGARPVVLIGAGVGVTPLLSMLHALDADNDPRQVTFLHSVRDGANHPFREEVDALVARCASVTRHFVYTRPSASDRAGRDFDSAGRLDGGRLERLVSHRDADYYLCGPTGFVLSLARDIAQLGVPAAQIATESFGGL